MSLLFIPLYGKSHKEVRVSSQLDISDCIFPLSKTLQQLPIATRIKPYIYIHIWTFTTWLMPTSLALSITVFTFSSPSNLKQWIYFTDFRFCPQSYIQSVIKSFCFYLLNIFGICPLVLILIATNLEHANIYSFLE